MRRNLRSIKADVTSGSSRAFKQIYGPVKNNNYNNTYDNLVINVPCNTVITIRDVNAILRTVHGRKTHKLNAVDVNTETQIPVQTLLLWM